MKEQTHLKEWHISNTLIQIIPTYIELFQAMRILDLPKNQISCLPAEIGMFPSRSLRVLVWQAGSWWAGGGVALPSPPGPGCCCVGLFPVFPELLVSSQGPLGAVIPDPPAELSPGRHSPTAQKREVS